jgi:hypothetical protein
VSGGGGGGRLACPRRETGPLALALASARRTPRSRAAAAEPAVHRQSLRSAPPRRVERRSPAARPRLRGCSARPVAQRALPPHPTTAPSPSTLAVRGRRRPGPRHRGDAAERGRARAWGADRRRDRAALRVPLRAHNPRRALPRSPACAQPAGALHDSEEGARHCLGDCVGPAAACSPRPEAAQGAGHDGRRAGPPRLTLRGAARSCPPPRIARSGKRAARAAAHIAQASIFWVMMGASRDTGRCTRTVDCRSLYIEERRRRGKRRGKTG